MRINIKFCVLNPFTIKKLIKICNYGILHKSKALVQINLLTRVRMHANYAKLCACHHSNIDKFIFVLILEN